MKKIFSAILILAIAASLCSFAYAEDFTDAFTVTNSSWTIRDTGKDNKFDVFFYAVIENTSGIPVHFKNALLQPVDANGTPFGDPIKLSSGDVIKDVLQPGEVGYIAKKASVKDVTDASAISGCTLEITANTSVNVPWVDLQGESTFKADTAYSTSYSADYISVETRSIVTNPNYFDVFGIKCGIVLFDQNGVIMYAGSESYSTLGMLPNSSIISMRVNGDPSLTSNWVTEGRVPTTIVPVAFAFNTVF